MLILKKGNGNRNRDNANREGVPVVLVNWIGTLSRAHALQVWTWLDKKPISGPQLIQTELQKRFQL